MKAEPGVHSPGVATLANRYSAQWFDFFHASIPEERTVREIGFILRVAPLPDFQRIVDVCCGLGRHARVLCERGYSVTGVERDPAMVAKARSLGGGPVYVETDVRGYRPEPDSFDVAIVMSQSFGFFDPTTNREVLARLADGLREGGRIILDLWNPEFFKSHEEEREFELPKGRVRERKEMAGGRLFVRLDYPDGGSDNFDWQVFSPGEMAAFAQSVGLTLESSGTGYRAGSGLSADQPRIQFVLKKSGP